MDMQMERAEENQDVRHSSRREPSSRTTLGATLFSRRSRRNDWSSEDLRRLRELAATGTPLDAIAAALRRTTSAVRNKAGMQGISLRPR
jgi:hypothetical protein|nr:hypothetical protein [uncultured Steroidobacter sp.]